MACFMESDHFFLFGRDDLVPFLQSAYDPVDGIHEILSFNTLMFIPGCDQCRLITHVGNVGSGKSGCLFRKKVNLY